MKRAATMWKLLTILLAITATALPHPRPTTFTDEALIKELLSLQTGLDDLPMPDTDTLMDLRNFTFTHNPKDVCKDSNLYFLFLVHSKPDNEELRRIIRDNWGSVRGIDNSVIRVVFLLGQPRHEILTHPIKRKVLTPQPLTASSHLENDLHSSQQTLPVTQRDRRTFRQRQDLDAPQIFTIQDGIDMEAQIYGDIIQGNFLDSFQNLTYKHLMGFKWLEDEGNCLNKPAFVVKTDDDIFVETYHLYNFVSAVYGDNPKRSLVCDVIPTGTTPRRRETLLSHMEQYVAEDYPEYCSGMAYLVTPDLAKDFLKAATKVPKFWLDDIYVTGYLRELLGLRPFYLNLRYTYDEKSYIKWLHSKPALPLPYLFASIETSNPDWRSLMKELWLKTLSIHLTNTTEKAITSQTFAINRN